MDNPKSLHELEQETILLQDLLEREKLKKAEELLASRLVFTTIIFLIILITLCDQSEYTSRGVQWIYFILFFGAALFALGFISRSYHREKDAARKSINNLRDILREKRGDYLYYVMNDWQ